jgi:adenylate kinase
MDYHGIDREFLKGVDEDENEELVRQMYEEQISGMDDIIVDGHYTLDMGDGELAGQTPLTEDNWYDEYWVMVADPEVIADRVQKDDKEREDRDPSDIERHQEFEKNYGRRVADLHNSNFRVIDNSGTLEETATTLEDLIDRVIS